MNRKQRRALNKKDTARKLIGNHQEFQENDKIRINVKAITSRRDYNKMLPAYRQFVESVGDTVFTAHVESKHLISLKEEPKWLFLDMDLIRDGK